MIKAIQKYAFLDRDGVVNVDHGYVHTPELFEFTPRFIDAALLLQQAGYKLVLVTNQSGIGRGFYTEAQYVHLCAWLVNTLAKQGVTLSYKYHCPHLPDAGCTCRKPKTGMIMQHWASHPARAQDCVLFGDKPSDMACAHAAGITQAYLVDTQSDPLAFYEAVCRHVAVVVK